MILSWYMITEGMKNTVRYDIDLVNLYFFVFFIFAGFDLHNLWTQLLCFEPVHLMDLFL